MRCLREKAQEEARRGEGVAAAPEGEGRAQGEEAGREARQGKGSEKGQGREGQPETAIERQAVEWRAPERACRNACRTQDYHGEVGDCSPIQGQAERGKWFSGLRLKVAWLECNICFRVIARSEATKQSMPSHARKDGLL